jgi:hypothetical protein
VFTHLRVPIDGRELPINTAHQAIALAKLTAIMVSPTCR